ncbi:hypothetical protein AB2V88_08235 [Clostridioides difficile]|uniref:NACHT domain-containing protein n=1 Tax=Clostridioides difficile TaxID=1496 RepID=UPI00098004A4|nr:hypothetical protein [Clostridioides difficile]EGT4545253.1 hypothetical protein [Clostridioides difficile]EGT4612707.1 hypothetical protein [Clostridioides difficile]EGT4779806.1 hypothetical protein [Clostridioides difficile]EGT5365203.1 hypothetical protein [Clostridioides difficile]EIS9404735.1 hypothetical protein [Clostridioides difficile]
MIDINWKKFEVKHPKATDAFESLCYFLFCRKYGLNEGIRTDFNQVGLETEPIKYTDGKYYGFQSKFFDKNVSYDNIYDSIKKALDNYDNLDYIIIYINKECQTSCKSAKKIEDMCDSRGIKVEWYLPNNFKLALNQPNNLDLAEFYFGATNVRGLLADSKSIRMTTLLQSKEYLELNLHNYEKTLTTTEYCKEVLSSKKKLHLVSGAAGTGKSVCMQKMLYIYGGFDEETKNKQLEKVKSLGAICIYINLNNTALESLENIVLNYKNTFFADSDNNNFIYLFDGIDEVPTSHITSTVLFIENLLEKENTKKIIISSRLSSYNKYILKASINEIVEYSIENLKEDQVRDYFENKGNQEKVNKLNEVVSNNDNFFEHVTDILTVSLLWDQINNINGKSFFTNLMDLSVSTIINDIHHRKYLESLNLPNPKEKAIIEINKNISFYLFEKDIFNFTYEDLHKLIGEIYPRCDYISLDKIIAYIAESFFDTSMTTGNYIFSYKHRRFSEYFTILKLEDKIRNDLNYLRENNIIINHDLFESMLIPYLQIKACNKKDLPLAFQIGLFNVYLGNDKAWGIDKEFYIWSDWIIYAIAGLDNEIFESIMLDSSLPISKFFNEVPKKIKALLSSKSKKNLSYNDELRQNFKIYVVLISLMHKFGKLEFLSVLLQDYKEIRRLCKENKFCFYSTSNKDNFLVWRSIIYINTVILNDNIDELISLVLQNSKDTNIDGLLKDRTSMNILHLNSLYYNMLIYHKNKCANMIENMNINQLSIFAITATNPECLNNIMKDKSLIEKIKQVLEDEISNENLSGVICLALKKFLGGSLVKKEEELVKKYLENIEFIGSSIFWKGHCDISAFILSVFGKGQIKLKIDQEIKRYVNVYKVFLELIDKSCSIERFICCVQKNIFNNTQDSYYIRILLGKVLSLLNDEDFNIKGSLDYLNDSINDSRILIIYCTMKLYNPSRFKSLLSITELTKLTEPRVYEDVNFTSTSESLFMLSFILSNHDKLLGHELLLKGISNGIMRMNDRKDTIGDYQLLDSLEILLINNWISTEKLIILLKRILKITNKMNLYNIENDTHARVMDIIQKYDFAAAEFYYNKIAHLEECYNLIHYRYALSMIQRGRNIKYIEACLDNIKLSFDRYHQKAEWGSFYYKIEVYLKISASDFYSSYEQKLSFEKACYKIDELEHAGWSRELKKEEYDIYVELCKKYNKKIDIEKEKENEYCYSVKPLEKENQDILEIINSINTEEDLCEFIKRLDGEYYLENLEINELFIKKCVDINGNIEVIIDMFTRYNYPSSLYYSRNSHNFWMTVLSALKNAKSKNSMMQYLLENGGGHDGFSELIKIYGYLGNKDICIKLFERMLTCVEFLLC